VEKNKEYFLNLFFIVLITMKIHKSRFKVLNIRADGNCLFRSIGAQIQRNHTDVRMDILRFFIMYKKSKIHGKTISEYISESNNCTLQEYIQKMRRDGEWGGYIEMFAAAWLYEITIHVFVENGEYYNRIEDIGDYQDHVFLLFSGNHYSILNLKN